MEATQRAEGKVTMRRDAMVHRFLEYRLPSATPDLVASSLWRAVVAGLLAAIVAFAGTTAVFRARDDRPAQPRSTAALTTPQLERVVQEDMQMRLPDPDRPGDLLVIARVACRRASISRAACQATPLGKSGVEVPVVVSIDERSDRVIWRVAR